MKLRTLLAAAIITALTFPACASAAENAKLRILSGPTSGAWYVGMGAVAKVISKANPELTVNLLPGGGLSNPGRLEKKEGEISLGTHSIMVSANKGVTPFKQSVKGVNSIFFLNDVSRLHLIGIGDKAPASLDEMIAAKKPVRIGVGPMGSGSELWCRWLLQTCYNVTYKDIQSWGGKIITNNWDDTVNMAKDGNIDMLVWLGPGEVWFVVELSKNSKLKWIPINDGVYEKMHVAFDISRTVIPASMFNGIVGADVPALCDGSEILVRNDLSDDLVYKITKAIAEGRDDIVVAIAGWSGMDKMKATEKLAFPLHPGAAKYFKEIGAIK